MRTLEQRRGELFGLAALASGLAVVPLPAFFRGRGREGRGGEGEGEAGWAVWKGGLPLVGAVLAAWAVLGEV